MVKNVLLIYVPSRKGVGEGELPLGLLYVASILERLGIKVKIFDLYLYNLTKEDRYGYFRIKGVIDSFNPDIVGFGGIATSYPCTKELSNRIKQGYPEIIQIAGGPLSSVYMLLLTKAAIDVVFHGEAEHNLPLFLERLNEMNSYYNIAGISYLEGGVVKRNQPAMQINNLDELPFPPYHLVELKRYSRGTQDFLNSYKDDLIFQGLYDDIRCKLEGVKYFFPIMTSRGCLYQCSFCFRQMNGYRKHSVEYVIRHIKFLKEHFGVNGLFFLDELFNSDIAWVMGLCAAIEKNNLKIAYRVGGGRVDRVSEEMLRRMYETGCVNINYGQESGSNKILKEYRKGASKEDNINSTLLTRKCRIYSTVQLVIGSPGETKETIVETIDFLKKVRARIFSLNYLIPLPGTPVWRYTEGNNLIKDLEQYLEKVAELGGGPIVNLTHVPAKEWKGWGPLIKYEIDLYYAKCNRDFLGCTRIFLEYQLKKLLPYKWRKCLKSLLVRYKKTKMSNGIDIPIILLTKDKFECLQLILWSWMRNIKILSINCNSIHSLINILKRIFFVKKYTTESIQTYTTSLSKYKGLWYEVSAETINLTLEFYSQEIKKNNKIVNYYNRAFDTNKFEAFLKKEISFETFIILEQFHLIRLLGLENKNVLIIKNPLNELVANFMSAKYKVNYQIKWITPIFSIFSLGVYYGWLLIEFLHRGLVFNKNKKEYKLSKEAAWGFAKLTLRDDIIVDNDKFKIKDVLLLEFKPGEPLRAAAFKDAALRGFDTVSVPKVKINVNKNIFNFLFFYLLLPFRWYLQLLFRQKQYLIYYLTLFHRKSFPVEVLMNLYRIKCHISVIDHADIVLTIVLNKYGAKNTIFQWSDLVTFRDRQYAFIAHNIYFVWSDMQFDFHKDNYFVDRKVSIGCIYKKEYARAIENKEYIMSRVPNLQRGRKIVSFFDTSFHHTARFTGEFFLEYLGILKDYCQMNKDVNVILKPKMKDEQILSALKGNLIQYEKILQELKDFKNFIRFDNLSFDIEEVISISDVCISMGMNTPSTLALICGGNGLYFDNRGNNEHPFAKKYRNIIVFDDKDLLLKQIRNILDGKFNCRDVISEEEIRQYDAFKDDNALERLRQNLYELTLEAQ